MTPATPITAQEVRATLAAWGQGVVEVGAAQSWEEAHARATRLVAELYINDGSLMFCPTRAVDVQFRRTPADAVSYFVGRSSEHPEDSGFALEPWVGVRFEPAEVLVRGAVAMTMGNYFFGRADGTELQAEFSMVFIRDEQGTLRFQLHHSALPFQAQGR